ncbi:MAG: hypothetical protein CMB77_02990 [Euryarchaeota archaeon]|nr:hypothetical protein [Euryarchaeota archaeon]
MHEDGEGDDIPEKESERPDTNGEGVNQNESSSQIQENENTSHDDDESEEEHAQEGHDGDEVVELDEDETAAIEETPTAINNDDSSKVVGPSGIDKDRIDSRLDSIRARRGSGKREGFPRTFEDLLLIAGCLYAMLYAVLLVAAPMIEPVRESFIIDEKLSATPLDTGEHPCNVPDEGRIAEIYPDNDRGNIIVWLTGVQNVNTNLTAVVTTEDSGETIHTDYVVNSTQLIIGFTEWKDGEYSLATSYLDVANDNISILSKTVNVEVSRTTVKGLIPFLHADESIEATVTSDGPRECKSVESLVGRGWALMGAELVGGRETAMLTGGAGGVPAWWMAFISLSLSIISLFILYPLIYKFYHRDADDLLSNEEVERLLLRCFERASKELFLDIDWERFQVNVRDLSYDIRVPYDRTARTVIPTDQIRPNLYRALNKEFNLFGLVKPFRLRLERTGDTRGADFDFEDFGQGTTGVDEGTGQERPQLVEDYRSFFSKVGSETRIQVSVQSSIADYFSRKRTDLIEKYTIVLGDSDLKDVYARVIFEPKKRKKVDAMTIREEIINHVKANLGSKLDERNLILHAVNRKADLMAQTGAGRIEQSDDDDTTEAVIARQDGIAGRVLQSAMVSGVLSTLEYTANENRRFIDRWGFFGLLVFVWIPFLASGVLVGAMLGLVARMRSKIVIAATSIGGTAASITWAYTAETIIHFMHKFQIDFVIPLIIGVFLLLAFLHIRTTKKRREAELFADTWIAVKDQVSESMEGS